MWLYLFSERSLEDTFENAQWRKVIQMLPMRYAFYKKGPLRTRLKTHSGEKSNKCNQCDYASSWANNVRTHLKTHSGEKPKNVTDVPIPLCRKVTWGHIWKRTVVKTHTNVTNATTPFIRKVIWGHIWKKHSGEKSNKCNQCDFSSSRVGNLRRNLKTHYGEK